MKKFQDMLKGKGGKSALNGAVLLFVAGLAIFILYGFFQRNIGGGTGDASSAPPQATGAPAAADDSYEAALEQKLEDTLSQIDGVGKVKVMLTLASGDEITVAQDSTTSNSSTSETDSGGGTRTTQSTDTSNKNVIIPDNSGNNNPLILTQSQPKVEGVIVVAEGGDSVFVRDAVTKAVAAVTNVDAYKIQVFKMK